MDANASQQLPRTTIVQQPESLPPPRLLLVDDDELILATLSMILTQSGFNVVSAGSVTEALRLILHEEFDILLSDLHMPGAGDGLTVVSAMRHANPATVTFIFSAYPEMKRAAEAIRLQADEIIAKPVNPIHLVGSIRNRLARARPPVIKVQTVANIIESEAQATIDHWLRLVDAEPSIPHCLNAEERSAHLSELLRNVVTRLRHPLPLGSKALVSEAAEHHGHLRFRQGYTAAMLVEESRMLQVSIFETLQANVQRLNFSLLLPGVMSIADEVDSQLAQSMAGYVAETAAAG